MFRIMTHTLRKRKVVPVSSWIYWFFLMLIVNYSLKGLFTLLFDVPEEYMPQHTRDLSSIDMNIAIILSNCAIIIAMLFIIGRIGQFLSFSLFEIRRELSLLIKIFIFFELALYCYIISTGKFDGLRREITPSFMELYFYGLKGLIYPVAYIVLSRYLVTKKNLLLLLFIIIGCLIVYHSLMNATKEGVLFLILIFYITLRVHKLKINFLLSLVGLIGVLV